jgi:aminopeptidase N
MDAMRLILFFILIILFIVFPAMASSPNLSWEEAKVRSQQLDDVAYRLYFRFASGSDRYQGKTVVTFNLKKPAAKTLFLDFQGDRLMGLSVNGVARSKPVIKNYRVYLPAKDLKAGKNSIVLSYENRFDTDGRGLHRFIDPVDKNEYFFSHFEPFDANRLFPCFDQPDLKASFSVIVEAPAEWKIISNTLAKVTKTGEQSRHEFISGRHFSTYLFALLGGPYAMFEDKKARIPSRLFSTRSMQPYVDAEDIFAVTRMGFDYFEQYFDIAYPFGKYDQIFVPHFNAGAMENVATVIINEDSYLYRETPQQPRLLKRANTILHEMAHMWFGDIVTMTWWNDLWLNESFATYMSYLAQAETKSDPDAWRHFSAGMKAWAYWQDQLPTTHPIETRVADTQSTFDNFDGITYGKGAAILKQLEFYVGKDVLRSGVSRYLKQYAWGNAQRRDFTDAVAGAAGLNLDTWTQKWLQNSGINILRTDYEIDDSGKISRFRLLQEKGNGDATLRPHRLQIALYYLQNGKLEIGKIVAAEIGGLSIDVPQLTGEVAPDFVFPNHGDYAYAKFYLDERSLAFARRHMEQLPGLVRSNVWSTLWFMVRDGKLPAAKYMEIFLDKAVLETDAKLVDSLHWNLYKLMDRLLSRQEWENHMRRFHEVSWKKLQQLPTDSSLYDIWFDFLLRAAVTPEAQERLLGLLSGTLVVPGLEISQDKRWLILLRLSAMGYADINVLLQKERQRDPGERGEKFVFSIRAAMPDPKTKEKIWQALLTDKNLPLTHVRAALDVFYQRSHMDLTRPYVKRYFDALSRLESEHTAFFARRFIQSAYPAMYVETDVLQLTDQALENSKDKPHFYRRLLLEARDTMQRSIVIRKGD